MAVFERQPQGSDVKQFVTRIPKAMYDEIEEWAVTNRRTFAYAVSILVGKAVEAEFHGKPYVPESDTHRA